MTTETIDTANLRALAEAATPGPWIHYPEDNIIVAEGQEHATLIDVCARSLHVPPVQRDANAALIAAANPAAILALLDRLAAAEARNATLTDDAARWQYAMDWNTTQFAVCFLDGMGWTPINNDGPIDQAMVAARAAASISTKEGDPHA